MRRLSFLVFLTLSTLACDDPRVAELEAELEQQRETADHDRRIAVELAAEAHARADAAIAKATLTIAELEAEIERQDEQISALEQAKGTLESELTTTEAALQAVKLLQDSLADTLVEEIETGDVRVSRRNGLLVVDVADTVLFGIGDADLSARGQHVLDRVAASLSELPKGTVFQVGGHTDNLPIKSAEVRAQFPTNWDLAAARAINVVRYLEETDKIPGKRLVAASFAQHRPVASNVTARGRAKNRRIEIALLPLVTT
jgi:chemotaxis protein MotB